MSNKKLDYVPSPDHAAAKLAKFERWQAQLAGMASATAPAPVGPVKPRPNNDKRDFIPADPIPGDKFAEQRGSLRDQAARLAAQREEILRTPTERRRRWEEAKARALEMLKDKELLQRLTPDQISAVKTAAEAVYSKDLEAKDEADKRFRVSRLTQRIG